MTAPERYGRRNVPKMIRQINDLRSAIRAEGTPSIQDVWDTVEEHIDFAYRRTSLADALALPEIAALVEAAETLRKDLLVRADTGFDALTGEKYRVVNAGNGAWHGFCGALSALTPADASKIGGD